MTWSPLPGPVPEGPKRLAWGLAGVARRLGAPPPAVLGVVFSRWTELAGPALADHCRPVTVRGGALVVAVRDPAWATELRYLGASLLRKAEELAGEPVAERLEVVVRPRG